MPGGGHFATHEHFEIIAEIQKEKDLSVIVKKFKVIKNQKVGTDHLLRNDYCLLNLRQ